VLHGGDEEPTVCRVIGLGEVRVQQPRRQAKLLEPGAETKVVADIVGNVAATEEGRLDYVNDIIHRALEAVGDDEHEQLDIAVEEGDGAIASKLVRRLPWLGDEADDAVEQLKKRGCSGGYRWVGHRPPWEKARLEGCVEDTEKEGDESRLEAVVELIGQPIFPRAGAPACSGDSQLHLLDRQEAVSIDALCQVMEAGRQGRGEAAEGFCLGDEVEGAGAEEASGRGGGIELASILEGPVAALFGGEGGGEGVSRGVPARLVKLGDGARPEGLLR
jgi:hypothetical protein